MKRSELKRRSPMRRTPMRRRTKSTSYSRRERFTEYMLAVKRLWCAARLFGTRCTGEIEADHAGARGMSQKAHDGTVIPLCTGHHYERTNFCGAFRSWDQRRMRGWLRETIAETRAIMAAGGRVVPAIDESDLPPA